MPHFLLRKLDVIEPRRVILTGYDVTVFITYDKLTRTSFSSRVGPAFKTKNMTNFSHFAITWNSKLSQTLLFFSFFFFYIKDEDYSFNNFNNSKPFSIEYLLNPSFKFSTLSILEKEKKIKEISLETITTYWSIARPRHRKSSIQRVTGHFRRNCSR